MRAMSQVLPVLLPLLLVAACSRPVSPTQDSAALPMPVPQSGGAWHAFGNEPFWSVEVRGTTLVFKTPEDQAGVVLQGRRVPSLVGTVILGRDEAGEFHLGITPGECSDGMSDRIHAYAATFIHGGRTYKGCAQAR
jgi:Predicted membrane protein